MTCLVPVMPHCYLCCLLSPHFPALPRTSPDWVPRTSPHFPALPWISLDWQAWERSRLFLLQKLRKDSASQPEIIKNTNRTACIQKSMHASHKFQIFIAQEEKNSFFHSKRCHKPRTNLYLDTKCLKVDLGLTKIIVSFQEMSQTKNKPLS